MITLLGEARAKHQVGYPYKDAGANATDNIDGNVPVTKSGEVNVNQIGTYTLTYRASDDFGNKAKEVSREIMVVADALPPVITLVGEATVSHKERDYYQDFGATALDESDGTVNVRTIGGVNIQTPGVYTLTYNARDTAGNAATPVTRTVEVVSSAIMNAHENMTFVTNGAKVTVTHCKKDASGVLEIPETFMGNAVTAIANNAFENCIKLTGVSIPGSLAAIGDRAFLGCAELREINFTGDHDYIEEGLVIWSHAFDGCSKLASFVLPEYTFVQKIGNYAFQDCSELTVYQSYFGYDDEGLTLGVGAFQRCSKLASFPWMEFYGTIGSDAFRGCSSLRRVEFSEGTGNIADGAFYGCTGLEYISFSPTTEEIGERAFDGCTSLEEINLEWVGRIGKNAFNDCVNLSRIYLSAGAPPELYYFKPYQKQTVANFRNISPDAKVYVDGGTNRADTYHPFMERSGVEVETTKTGKEQIIINEYAKNVSRYMILNHAELEEEIELLVNEKRISGISAVRNESDEKPRLVIELKRGANSYLVTENLYRLTQLDRSRWKTDHNGRPIKARKSYSYSTAGEYVEYDLSLGKWVDTYCGGLEVIRPDPDDKTPPEIVLFGDAFITINLGQNFKDQGANVIDNVDPNRSIYSWDTVDTSRKGSYSLPYYAQDFANNYATSKTRTVYVVDKISPSITLNGTAKVSIEAGEGYVDAGALAKDNYDTELTVTTSGEVNAKLPGTYTLTYKAVDESGNEAEPLTRTVVVTDTTSPVINLLGNAVNHDAGKDYVDSTPTVVDNAADTVTVTTSGKVNVNEPDTYTLTYNAVDASGNKAEPLTRTVVVVDTTPPVITLLGDAVMTIGVGSSFTDPGAHVTDSFEKGLSFTKTGIVDMQSLGSYTLTYNAIDEAGNAAKPVIRTVHVKDLTPPVITLTGDPRLHVMRGTTYQDDGASAIDNVDGPVAVTTSGNVDSNTLGDYTLTYTASDQAGNEGLVLREIKVINPEIANGLKVLTFIVRESSAIVNDCDKFASGAIEIPSTYKGKPVTSIEGSAFYKCGSLTSITIPNSVEFIGKSTFEDCESLSSVIIGSSVTSIAEKAFMNCSELKSVTIPDSVTSIGNNAFQHCSKLENAAIGSSVTSIGNYSFANCTKLKIVNIGASINSIGEYAFDNCSELESVTIPDSVAQSESFPIQKYAFNKCTSLIDFTIPDSVTFIGNSAFENCKSLRSVAIPDNVASIKTKTFMSCESLSSVIIGNGVTSIAERAFMKCYKLTSVSIPNSVSFIGLSAFYGCESLTSVTIGDSVTFIGNSAFEDCKSLTSVTIPDSVTSIGDRAFSFCSSLTSVTIGDSAELEIGSSAFSRCGSLTRVTFEGNAPRLKEDVFLYSLRGGKVYVKANATGFGITFGGLPVDYGDSTTTASKGNTSDGPIMDAVVFFDVNLNGLVDESEPQTTSNSWGDYWLDIPLETYDLNDNGVIDISEGVIVSQGGTDTATGLPVKTTLKGPASATVITPLTTLVTRVMEQNPELDAGAAADKLEASLGIPDGVDILSFDTFKEAGEENPSAADVLTATAKLQDTLVQGGNLIGGATGMSLQEGSDAVMDAIAQEVEAGNIVDLDSKGSLKSLITEAASTSGAILTEAQTEGAASIMEASSKAKEDAKAVASTVTELATQVSRVQAVSQSKAADDLEAVGAQTAELESTVLAYTGAAMQQQVQTEVVGDFNASSYEAPVFAFQSASYTVKENGQQQPVIQINRTGDSFEAVELTVTPIASSATAGEDFNGEPVSVSFEPLEIRKTLDLQTLVIDDELVEEAETLSLQLEVMRDPEDPDLPEGEEDLFTDRPTVGTIGLATLTIINDDIANEAPAVSTMDDLVISEGAEQVSVDFSVTDTDSTFDELTVQASTSNPFLISGLVVEGTVGEQDASQWTLDFAIVSDQFGEGTIMVEINDGYQSASTSFSVTVSAVNNAPQISGIPPLIEVEGGKIVVPFEVSDDQTSAGNLFIYMTAQPLDYILKGDVLVVGNGAQRELILNNSGNAEGTGQFSVVVTDAGGKTATQAFEVNFGGEPPVAVVPELKLNTSDPSNLTLSWEGDAKLLFTEDLSAGFVEVAGATSPYTIEQGNMGFFILRVEP
ncbi:leucine-rich repeat protein [Verrucomicrobia bacterium]|nr:leucine-rich repeat protein [Verrucomicrobiota bacterium]